MSIGAGIGKNVSAPTVSRLVRGRRENIYSPVGRTPYLHRGASTDEEITLRITNTRRYYERFNPTSQDGTKEGPDNVKDDETSGGFR